MRAATSLSVGGRPSFCCSLGHRDLDLAHVLAHVARHPVAAAQLVEHGAADALHRIGLELRAMGFFIAADGVQQADHAGLDQVVDLDAGRQLGASSGGRASSPTAHGAQADGSGRIFLVRCTCFKPRELRWTAAHCASRRAASRSGKSGRPGRGTPRRRPPMEMRRSRCGPGASRAPGARPAGPTRWSAARPPGNGWRRPRCSR